MKPMIDSVTTPHPCSLRRLEWHMRITPQSALTRIDLITIVGTTLILLFLLGPVLSRSRAKSSKTQCVNNLKNIGLAFRIYSTDASPDFALTQPC